jgi:glutathione S-transferase
VNVYGTTTSPYTRKARILVRAAGYDAPLIDTRTDEGARALAAIAPLGKVPVLQTDDGLVLPDSGLIAAWLWAHRGEALQAAGFQDADGDWEARARTVIVEGALDAAINRFYLRRDGLPEAGYITRQRDRVAIALDWLEPRAAFARPISAATLSLGCALDWMVLRQVTDLLAYPRLTAFRDAWTSSRVGAGTEPG